MAFLVLLDLALIELVEEKTQAHVSPGRPTRRPRALLDEETPAGLGDPA